MKTVGELKAADGIISIPYFFRQQFQPVMHGRVRPAAQMQKAADIRRRDNLRSAAHQRL